MRWTRFCIFIVCFLLGWVLAGSLIGCATAQYHQPDRERVEPVAPVELGAWPDAIHIVCPDHDDPGARCPAGEEFAGYDLESTAQVEAFVTAAQANEEIAELQADQVRALDAEAEAANRAAAELEAETEAQDRARFLERLGWIGVLALTVWVAL